VDYNKNWEKLVEKIKEHMFDFCSHLHYNWDKQNSQAKYLSPVGSGDG